MLSAEKRASRIILRGSGFSFEIFGDMEEIITDNCDPREFSVLTAYDLEPKFKDVKLNRKGGLQIRDEIS